MTTRDFFIVLFKVVGLFIVLMNIFSTLPAMLPFLALATWWQAALSFLSAVLIMVGLYVLLVVKADWLVDKLKITKGLREERITLGSPNKSTLVHLAVIFVAGSLWVNHIPAALLEISYLFKNTVNSSQINLLRSDIDFTQVLLHAAAVLIGYLLFTNSARLTTWIVRRQAQ